MMNVLLFLALAILFFYIASKVYAGYIAKKLGENPNNPTPATIQNDGRDYVPTKRYVVFAHHFSAIAGAGPIIGPTMAILYGLVPAWIWVVFGGIFFIGLRKVLMTKTVTPTANINIKISTMIKT